MLYVPDKDDDWSKKYTAETLLQHRITHKRTPTHTPRDTLKLHSYTQLHTVTEVCADQYHVDTEGYLQQMIDSPFW